MKNNYNGKIIRTITSPLSVQDGRSGLCKRCGECCKLPKPCIFLDFDKSNISICKIYKFRPISCRKYPRTSKEQITKENCSFYFEND